MIFFHNLCFSDIRYFCHTCALRSFLLRPAAPDAAETAEREAFRPGSGESPPRSAIQRYDLFVYLRNDKNGKPMRMIPKIAAVAAAAILAASCCPCRSYQKKTRRPLVGTEWQLVQLGGRSVQPQADRFHITFQSEEGPHNGRRSLQPGVRPLRRGREARPSGSARWPPR